MQKRKTFENGYIASEEFPEYIEHFLYFFPGALMLRWQQNNSAREDGRPRSNLALMIEAGWCWRHNPQEAMKI